MTHMPSYKPMWQEANRRIEWLESEVARLNALVEASPDEAARELDRIRQIVDLAGIARHMHVERFTPQQWKQRDHLPPVDFSEIREPLWYASTIRDGFARPTGRLWCSAPTTLYAVGCTTPHEVSRAAA